MAATVSDSTSPPPIKTNQDQAFGNRNSDSLPRDALYHTTNSTFAVGSATATSKGKTGAFSNVMQLANSYNPALSMSQTKPGTSKETKARDIHSHATQ